ncbi:MAG: xanthine dehydrogenase family protein molybdopterin-binding subunit, partial [Chloroflexi bacterium]|nr:xanthine dehydrogenase family protein molybdopterin-binding subunit [Chloroflexota bacterium]
MSIPVYFQPKFVGQSIKRVEDPLLLTGKARHIDDLAFPDMLHVAFVRSPHPHARIRSIDTRAALQVPGVEYVLTGQELSQHAMPGSIAFEKVRYVGEPVVAVAAISRYVAEDAVEQIKVDYEVLPPVADARQAMEPTAARLYDNMDNNVTYKKTYTYGDPEGALGRSEVVVRGHFRSPRVSANPIETGGCISAFDPVMGEVTSWSNAQVPRMAHAALSAGLRLPFNRVRVIVQPHGGSFGSKLAIPKYMIVTAVLSKLCGGRPVKYIEDRIEHLMASGSHAWERLYDVEFGFMRDGRCTAMRIRAISDIGASGGVTQTLKALTCLTGAYKVRDVEFDVTGVFTNKGPDGAYRGYGPPTHTMVLERMMDKGAAALGLDPAEIRRRNFIQPDEFPYTLPSGVPYDSGNYPEVLRVALESSGYAELRREQERLRAAGRLAGISVVFGIEPGGYWGSTGPYREWGPGASAAPEAATIALDATGQFQVEIYHALSGQGHFSFATQLVADYFGVPLEAVRVATAEPKTWPPSSGPLGSRLAVTLTFAIIGAAERLRDKFTKVAAQLLEAPEEVLELRDGAIRVREAPQRSLSLVQIARTMLSSPNLLPPGMDANPAVTYVWTANRPVDA